MRVALDPYMLRHVPLTDLPAVVRDLGYDAIELSPRDDCIPFFRHPRIGSAGIGAFRAALDRGRRGGRLRPAALPLVRAGRGRAPGRGALLEAGHRGHGRAGLRRMNSELNGRPEAAGASEAQFWRSMEELLPIFEREGVDLALEAASR